MSESARFECLVSSYFFSMRVKSTPVIGRHFSNHLSRRNIYYSVLLAIFHTIWRWNAWTNSTKNKNS